jgi:hypothetical protein
MKNTQGVALSLLVLMMVLVGGFGQLAQGCNAIAPNPSGSQPATVVADQLDQPFTLFLGQTVEISEAGLTITFVDVLEDSRCPGDVDCFWEGQATILLTIQKTDQPVGTLELTYRETHEELATKKVNNYTITLVNIAPDPVSTVVIQPADYQATLRVSPA